MTWKDESERQANIFAEAIERALNDAVQTLGGQRPFINAVIGALTMTQARFIASVDQPANRKALRRAIARELSALSKSAKPIPGRTVAFIENRRPPA